MQKTRFLSTCILFLSLFRGPLFPYEDRLAFLAGTIRKAAVGLVCKGPNGNYFGTGTVIRNDGVILTSSTVLPPGASDIKAFMPDGRTLSVNLVTVDKKLEISLARVEGGGFFSLPLGSSEKSRVGEPVFTLGNAYNNASGEGRVSVGRGILSGKYTLEETQGEASYKGKVLETDAPLNPGSDGGALVDVNGAVIGVLSLNYSLSRFLGTAVPIDLLRDAIEGHIGKIPYLDKPKEPGVSTEVYEKASKTVVSLDVNREEDEKSPAERVLKNDPRREILSDLFTRPEGLITGLCISNEGLILTSRYNLAGTLKEVKALDAEGSWHTCKILGRDKVDDIALLKAEGGTWHAAEFADPAHIAPGRSVFVLGRSPQPASVTLTSGIIGVARRNKARLFQHDAAVNAGNSGGPIIDREGRVLGIAVFVGHLWPEWSMNSGIAFGVRPDTVNGVLAQLKKGEDLEWPSMPFLGVRKGPHSSKVIIEVVQGHAAQEGGLRSGDEILKIGTYTIKSWIDLQRAVNAYKAGDKVEIVVRRKDKEDKDKEDKDKEETVTVTLGKRPRRL